MGKGIQPSHKLCLCKGFTGHVNVLILLVLVFYDKDSSNDHTIDKLITINTYTIPGILTEISVIQCNCWRNVVIRSILRHSNTIR